MFVYVEGLPNCGLGNILFQIAAAVYYAEKYGYTIVLNDTYDIKYGTSTRFGRNKLYNDSIDNSYQSYDKTIFKNLAFITDIDFNSERNFIKIDNIFSNNKIEPNGRTVIIGCFSQNIDLFYEYINQIPKYLNLNDTSINTYIKNKYGVINNDSVCIGIRIGLDFSKMNGITIDSYKKALKFYKDKNVNIKNVYLIADVNNASKLLNLDNSYNCIEVDESDIVQFYIGLLCSNYILSESTFHLWIAYLGCINNNKNVICFNNTDITNKKLDLPNWYKIDA
jgi:hypothetical protein